MVKHVNSRTIVVIYRCDVKVLVDIGLGAELRTAFGSPLGGELSMDFFWVVIGQL